MPYFSPACIVATLSAPARQDRWPVTFHVCEDPNEPGVYFVTDEGGDSVNGWCSETDIDSALREAARKLSERLAR